MSKHAVRHRAGEDRANLYDEITDKIIAELEVGRSSPTPILLETRAGLDRSRPTFQKAVAQSPRYCPFVGLKGFAECSFQMP